MKKFKELNVGDTFYEHIGSQVTSYTVREITKCDTKYETCDIEYNCNIIGTEKKATVLSNETSLFPFYTSLEEITSETALLIKQLQRGVA